MSEELSELLKIRRDKINDFRAAGMEPFPYRFGKDAAAKETVEKYAALQEGEESQEDVSLAGRIMTKRGHGKASFATIQDETGRVQVYARQDVIGPESYDLYTKIDIGDFIGVSGHIFRTKTGELTVRAQN